MNDYILFMHRDTSDGRRNRGEDEWTAYFAKLRQAGVFQGGSAIGDGVCVSKSTSPAPDITQHLSGEAGGTIEIRELPRS